MAGEMRILVDLNVVLDVLQSRRPFYEDSARVLDAVVRKEVAGWLAAHSLTTLFYVVNRQRDRETAVAALTGLLDVFTVAGVDYLVTRNPRDFPDGPVPVILPAALPPLLKK